VPQSQEFLEKQGYVPLDAQGGKASLSYMLLLLVHCMPPSLLPKAISAVAAVLECEETAKTANMIVAMVMHRLYLVLDLIDHAADMAQEAVEDTRKAVDYLYRMGEEMRDKLQKGVETTKDDIQKAMGEIKDKAGKLAGVAAMLIGSQGNMPVKAQVPGVTRTLYVDTVGSRLLATHLSTLARTQVKERQVLVDKDPLAGAGHNPGLGDDASNVFFSSITAHQVANSVGDTIRMAITASLFADQPGRVSGSMVVVGASVIRGVSRRPHCFA